MKVALIAGPFLPVPPQKYGGTERVIASLIQGLQELGHQVTLFATADSQVDCELIPITDKPLKFGLTTREHEEIILKEAEINANTMRMLKEKAGEFDIIHSHGFDLKGFDLSPAVTTLHGKFTLDHMEYYEARKELDFISISNNQRESFPDLNYVGTAYNGLDPDVFPVVLKPKDYVCFIGRFDREKNPHRALELAVTSGIPIKVAGKIDFFGSSYFEEEVKPYFDNPLVEYLGELGMQEKIELISNAKCNLHPTNFREPFGLTVLETAYCGTPTIAIEKGSMPELIEDERTGFLVEDFDEAYHYLESCEKLDRNYISTRARSLFNYKSMAKQYLDAYQVAIEAFASKQALPEKSDVEKSSAKKVSNVQQVKNVRRLSGATRAVAFL